MSIIPDFLWMPECIKFYFLECILFIYIWNLLLATFATNKKIQSHDLWRETKRQNDRTKNRVLFQNDIHFFLTFFSFCLLAVGIMRRVFANGPGNRGSIPGRVILKTQKWYLMPPWLRLSTIMWGSMVKWSNPGNGLVPSPIPRCSSYWKGSLRVILD